MRIIDKTISYTYDKVGRRDSMTDPEGDVIYYDYGHINLIRIKRNATEEAYFAYDAGGRRNYTVLGNSSYTYYDYDINGRLVRVANHKSDDSVISSFEYTLDPVGNRTSMTLASGDTVYYEYDGIYQLVKEDRRESDNDLVYINYFEYDLAGNRTHLHYVDTSSDDWTYYTYNIENQLTIEEKGGSATYYEYDAAGALISKITDGDESTYDYTYEGQMDEYASGENTAYYIYDADKKRVQAKRDDTVEKYALSGNDVVADYDGDDTLVATYNTPGLDNNLTKKVGENVYFFTKDGLGSIRNILDSDETIQNTYDYLAFGSIYGTPVETISNPFRFTGRRWDSESSLHFYRARMMDQTLGRFIAKDSLGMQSGTNRYLYVGNRPVLLSDPMGLYTVMFRGIRKGDIESGVLDEVERLIRDQDESEFVWVYEHGGWDSAAEIAIEQVFSDSYLRECEKIHVIGYSCGADSALSFVKKLNNDPRTQSWDLEIENLIYLDFNWGATHVDECRHLKDNNYKIPDCVKHKYHYVSKGTMTAAARPEYPTIVQYTHRLWNLVPHPWLTWGDWLLLTTAGYVFSGEGLGMPLINTTGFNTVDHLRFGYDWPTSGIKRVPKDIDHLQMGEDLEVSQEIADIVNESNKK